MPYYDAKMRLNGTAEECDLIMDGLVDVGLIDLAVSLVGDEITVEAGLHGYDQENADWWLGYYVYDVIERQV